MKRWLWLGVTPISPTEGRSDADLHVRRRTRGDHPIQSAGQQNPRSQCDQRGPPTGPANGPYKRKPSDKQNSPLRYMMGALCCSKISQLSDSVTASAISVGACD